MTDQLQPPYPNDPLGYGSKPAIDLTGDLNDPQVEDLVPDAYQPVEADAYAPATDAYAPAADAYAPATDAYAPATEAASLQESIDTAELDRTFPEGTVDLTGETPLSALSPAGDFTRKQASLYGSAQGAWEPVSGTVEVERTVTQPYETVVMPVESVLDDHRAARARALGEVDPGADVVAAPPTYAVPSVYRAWPSLTLFIFRIVIATLLSIRATQELLHFTATKNLWATSILPQPAVLAVVQVIIEYLIALLLLLGLANRVAGVMMVVVYIGVLSFVTWGAVNPFVNGVLGFRGEFEVMMTTCGLVLAGIGGGRVAIDATVHKARLEKKNARLG